MLGLIKNLLASTFSEEDFMSTLVKVDNLVKKYQRRWGTGCQPG